MATTLNITVRSRQRDTEGGLQVTWWPVPEELVYIAWHAQYFPAGWTEQEVADYGLSQALPGVFAAIDSFFPGEYEQGTVV
jgi:hypothetical protein